MNTEPNTRPGRYLTIGASLAARRRFAADECERLGLTHAATQLRYAADDAEDYTA